MKKVLLAIVSILIVHCAQAQWSAMGAPGGKVRALCVHNGELYAGGDFTGLVKKWNGSAWVAVGSLSGTTSPKVNALISYNGSLYAGGSFQTATSNFNVAKWNGSSWVTVGDGLQGVSGSEVKAFCNYVGTLYAAGTFNQSGTASLSKVGKLNSTGTAWSQVGGGAPTYCSAGVYAMTVFNSQLYVGGQGSAPWVNLLNLNGTQWDNLATTGQLSQGTGIYALTPFKYPNSTNNTLFLGGDFSSPFASACSYSNNSWGTVTNAFSNGVADQVNCCLATYNGASGTAAYGPLYAGGVFSVTGLHTAVNIAKRTITLPWDNVGTDAFNAGVRAMCYYNGYLVAGGDFTTPGAYVARISSTDGIDELQDNLISNIVSPNPVSSKAILNVQTRNDMLHPALSFMDVNGKVVEGHTALASFSRSQNAVEFIIDREGLSAGIYYYSVVDEERIVATGKVVIE